MGLAVYGKHPAKGDFLDHGVPAALRPALEGWLDQVLAQARADLGAEWERVWAAAPMLRFWLGEGIWGQSICGVMAATQDRVGRRFPLVLLALGSNVPPPVVDADQGWFDGTAAHLARMLRLAEIAGPAALLTGAPLPAPMDQPGPPEFWAVRPGDEVGELLADIALTDHRRAAIGRSYWWVAGDAVADLSVAEPVAWAGDNAAQDPEAVEEEAGDTADPADEAPPAEDTRSVEEQTEEPAPEQGAQPEAEPSPWDVAPVEAFDDSPFAATAGPSLFAAPLPPDQTRAEAPVAMVQAAPVARGPLWSQVWAGEGLPPGAVIAWFLRGHDGNG